MFKSMLNFSFLKIRRGNGLNRFQYTAIDDATRIRALKIYVRRTHKMSLIL